MFYLYCNSPASSVNGLKGFVRRDEPLNFGGKMRTTTEFGFALDFNSFELAEHFVDQHNLCAIIFHRKGLC